MSVSLGQAFITSKKSPYHDLGKMSAIPMRFFPEILTKTIRIKKNYTTPKTAEAIGKVYGKIFKLVTRLYGQGLFYNINIKEKLATKMKVRF